MRYHFPARKEDATYSHIDVGVLHDRSKRGEGETEAEKAHEDLAEVCSNDTSMSTYTLN